jgi:hypothetical protein
MEDFVTWVDTSKLKRTIMKYNDEVCCLAEPVKTNSLATPAGRLRSVITFAVSLASFGGPYQHAVTSRVATLVAGTMQYVTPFSYILLLVHYDIVE